MRFTQERHAGRCRRWKQYILCELDCIYVTVTMCKTVWMGPKGWESDFFCFFFILHHFGRQVLGMSLLFSLDQFFNNHVSVLFLNAHSCTNHVLLQSDFTTHTSCLPSHFKSGSLHCTEVSVNKSVLIIVQCSLARTLSLTPLLSLGQIWTIFKGFISEIQYVFLSNNCLEITWMVPYCNLC